MIHQYNLWKQNVINEAVTAHKDYVTDVNELGDPQVLALYDKILDILTGPHTIRLRRSPGLLDVLRLRKAQRSFARALYHHKKIADLSK